MKGATIKKPKNVGLMTGEHVFYDCEFLEDGHTIELISIGIVSERGEYYAVNRQMDQVAVWEHPFLAENVVPHLPLTGNYLNSLHPDVKPKSQIAEEVSAFIQQHNDPNLWAWYSAYDHVSLAQLFGPMICLPAGVPMQTDDLKTVCKYLGNPRVPAQKGTAHNALADAEYAREIFNFLSDFEKTVNLGGLYAGAK